MSKLSRHQVTIAASGTGTNMVPASTYTFLTTAGLYGTGLSDATEIEEATMDNDMSEFPLTTIKELIRGGVLNVYHVKISGVGNTTAANRGTIYASSDVEDADTAILGKSWPVGAAAGGTILSVYTPVRRASLR